MNRAVETVCTAQLDALGMSPATYQRVVMEAARLARTAASVGKNREWHHLVIDDYVVVMERDPEAARVTIVQAHPIFSGA